MNLRIEPFPGLKLTDPFIIASSHWTATESAFKQLSTVQPSALTLKTTSESKGGDGKETKSRGRQRKHVRASLGNIVASYTDGPKEIELWDLATTYEMTDVALRLLPSTKLGLSILQGEDYEATAKTLGLNRYAYVELNWKYSFRSQSLKQTESHLPKIEEDLERFLKCFSELPKLIKLPRESIPFIQSEQFASCLSKLNHAKAGLLVANSKRIRIPPSRVDGDDIQELSSGVVVGEYLFLETYDTIKQITASSAYKQAPVQCVATGGIIDTAGVIDMLAAGANAVELCTVLDLRGVQVVPMLREQLWKVSKEHGSLAKFIAALRSSNEIWFSAVARARSIEVQDKETIERALSPGNIRPLFRNALKTELSYNPTEKLAVPLAKIDPEMKFVINYANIGAFFLGIKCIERHKMHRIDVEGVGELAKKFKDPNFSYDFVIMPRSAVRSLIQNLSPEMVDQRPTEIGQVGWSLWEIVGQKLTQGKHITSLYHFGGTSARHALPHFLKTEKPKLEKITPPMLLPSLRYWHEENGILAKPPLSMIYGLLAEGKAKSNWGQFWMWQEPLVLAASKAHCDAHGLNSAQYLLQEIQDISVEAQADYDTAVTQLFSSNFMAHCLKLVSPLDRAGNT